MANDASASDESAFSPARHRQAALDLLSGHAEILEELRASIRSGVAPHASVLALQQTVIDAAQVHATLALSAWEPPEAPDVDEVGAGEGDSLATCRVCFSVVRSDNLAAHVDAAHPARHPLEGFPGF